MPKLSSKRNLNEKPVITVDTVHGIINSVRKSPEALICWFNKRAIKRPIPNWRRTVPNTKTNVTLTELKKLGSAKILLKFLNPTNSHSFIIVRIDTLCNEIYMFHNKGTKRNRSKRKKEKIEN